MKFSFGPIRFSLRWAGPDVIPTEGPQGPSGGICEIRIRLQYKTPHRLVLSEAEGRVE